MSHDTKGLRQLLPRTWYAFLGRFPQPTAIQLEAVPAILRGEPLLLASPTATGKTEAYAAPLVERLLREKWPSPAILIVSPTRALANDLYRRLQAPLKQMRVALQRRTGDHAQWDEEHPGAVIVTTGESLDSLLSRRPHSLKTVRAVVLDELHVVHGTARGDQLALLMKRLERVAMGTAAAAAAAGRAMPVPLQRIAATATAGRMEAVAERYLGRGARVVHTSEHRVIVADLVSGMNPNSVLKYLRGSRAAGSSVGGSRRSKADSVESGDQEIAADSVDEDADSGRHAVKPVSGIPAMRKVLIFANSRGEVENFGAACFGKAPFGREVFVHHASLSRVERERVEKRFLESPTALCFATMTLELGIDIGDIDLVGMLGPPADVASFLQRVGRGNRRRWDETSVVCFYDNAGQKARLEHLLQLARAGNLPGGSTVFRPSVLVQQAFSLLFQNRSRWVDAKSFAERLPAWVLDEYPVQSLEELLEHLAEGGWLIAMSGGRYGPAERLEKMFVRGLMHSNIASDRADLEVVDEATERVVGYLSEGVRGRSASGEIPRELVLGGQRRTVKRVSGKQVRVAAAGHAVGAQFRGQGAPAISFELAQSLRTFLGIEEQHLRLVPTEHTLVIAHFMGSAYGRLFLECLKRCSPGLTAAGNAFVCAIARTDLPELHFSETDVLAEISKRRRALSAALQDGPNASRLPKGWWATWLQEALDVPKFLTLVDTLVPEVETNRDRRRVLLSLAPSGSEGDEEAED